MLVHIIKKNKNKNMCIFFYFTRKRIENSFRSKGKVLPLSAVFAATLTGTRQNLWSIKALAFAQHFPQFKQRDTLSAKECDTQSVHRYGNVVKKYSVFVSCDFAET